MSVWMSRQNLVIVGQTVFEVFEELISCRTNERMNIKLPIPIARNAIAFRLKTCHNESRIRNVRPTHQLVGFVVLPADCICRSLDYSNWYNNNNNKFRSRLMMRSRWVEISIRPTRWTLNLWVVVVVLVNELISYRIICNHIAWHLWPNQIKACHIWPQKCGLL